MHMCMIKDHWQVYTYIAVDTERINERSPKQDHWSEGLRGISVGNYSHLWSTYIYTHIHRHPYNIVYSYTCHMHTYIHLRTQQVYIYCGNINNTYIQHSITKYIYACFHTCPMLFNNMLAQFTVDPLWLWCIPSGK